MLIRQSTPTVYTVELTLEQVHALGILLDVAPVFRQPLESVLDTIYDIIDPILCYELGFEWDAE